MFSRYIFVGLVSNGILYFLFLMLIQVASPMAAMSLCYLIGVVQTFIFNKNWTFGASVGGVNVFLKYAFSYLLGYIVKWLLIHFFVISIGFDARFVQFLAIGFVAFFIFFLQKFWVFKRGAS